jgi:hypothetical protein
LLFIKKRCASRPFFDFLTPSKYTVFLRFDFCPDLAIFGMKTKTKHMKHKLLFLASICLSVGASAQVFWTEDFGTGCNQGQLASAFTGTNGAWSIASTGTNDPQANTWYVGAMEAGNAVGACGSGCGGTNDASLHLSNVAIPAASLAADNGASYLSGGLCGPPFNICCITNRRAQSPVINCTGKFGITLSCAYMEGGDGTNDDGTLWYSADGGTTWSLLDNMAKTPLGSCSPQGMWTAYTFSLPASADNNANVRIGFNWVNNDDAAGNDPSFAVDDITLSTVATGVTDPSAITANIFVADNNVVIKAANSITLEGVYDVVGRKLNVSLADNIIDMTSQPAGVYFVRAKINGQVVTKKVFIR